MIARHDTPPMTAPIAPTDADAGAGSVGEAELRRLQELCEKATKSPWQDDGYRVYGNMDARKRVLFEYKHMSEINYADFELIAAARNALPQLLADLSAARAQVAEMRGERDALRLALDKIEPFGAIVIDKLRHYGFVFKNAPAAKLDTADEAVKWENMAFSLYTDIAEMSSLARVALEAASADGSGGGSGG